MDSSGFYKLEGNDVLYAPNFVYNKNYELLREQNKIYQYPVDGWIWFETVELAYSNFKIEYVLV